jgi:hypothetical protein
MSDEIETTSREPEDDEFLNDGDLESRPALPPPDFDFLVYSLRLQTELNLGLLPFGDPGEEQTPPDLELARHNIDLLAMLQEKTKGNLSAEEQRALDNSVAELRFRFVQVEEELKLR